MKSARIKASIVAVLAVVAFAGAQAWKPTLHLADRRPKVELESMFPRAFGKWVQDEHMPVTLVAPDTQSVLDRIYAQTLSRTYVDEDGDRIMLSVAYGGDQSDATRAHRPEVCYPVQGFEILSSNSDVLALGNRSLRVRRLVSKMGSRVEPITYWITVGDRVTVTTTEQKLAQLSYSTRGLIPDGMLVRVSSIDGDISRAFSLQQSFISGMAEALSSRDRSQVVGYGTQ